MWTSASPPSSLLLPARPPLAHQNSPNFYRSRVPARPLRLHLSAALLAAGADSWLTPPDEECNGWAFVQPSRIEKKRGLSKYVLVGVGASAVLALAAAGYFAVTRRGLVLELRSPFAQHESVAPVEIGEEPGNSVVEKELRVQVDKKSQERNGAVSDTVESGHEEKAPRILKSVAVDSTQEEALSVLTKLKIIENDIEAGELCTRREYARWLVKENTLLERNPRHRIIPCTPSAGFMIMAFDDIPTEDPDFGAIQGLAEAGIEHSKLLANTLSDGVVDSSKGQGIYFFPERPISRQDLISWRAHFEYDWVSGIEETSRPTVGYMDMKTISLDVSPALCLDMLAGDKSITRKVFGKTKRFEPKKPVTRAQAAVALTSGRMALAIKVELQRLEAENYARQLEIDEIMSELLSRGEIIDFWDQKLNEEYARRRTIDANYHALLIELNQEKVAQEKFLVECGKEKSALECQRQLVLSLKEEISEMTKRLESERATCAAEQQSVQVMRAELQSKLEAARDAKSTLEAEKEAVTILRTWVEDEARKNQARAKLLEEVGRRWNWDNHD
uniref:SLH domain-containing protein n=1 Tax=Kalanchoe fedtschenkoi TaxID=63787 RepID=A0A7N0U2L9_KALFE